jgi:endonuclease/exonuclease/phosphatase family metal-dependent hydrolase
MKVVTYNIQWGKGRDGLVDLERVARTVAGADIVALQEVERYWRDMPHADQVARLTELFPDHHSAFCTAVDFHNPDAPAQRRQYGLMALSRWPILAIRSFPLPRVAVLGQVSDPSILMECIIGHPETPFRLYITHLNWVSARARLLQAEAIVGIVAEALVEGPAIAGPGAPDSEFEADWMMIPRKDLPPMPAPAILLGDFNMQPDEPGYVALCGPVSPWYGRLVENGLFSDVLSRTGMPETEGITFPSDGTTPGLRIDHILCTPDLAPSVRDGWIDALAEASDHQPVWAVFDMKA